MASHPHQEPQHPHHELHSQPVVYQPNNTASATQPPPTASTGQPVFDLNKFWQEEMSNAKNFDSDFKNHALPLARIKKVMKTDQEVKMISAEAPILFAKGCEIFITELTKRAWVHAEENKRRTLQRSDIATAISKTDMCDFLIDIVPREEAAKSNTTYDQSSYPNNTAPAYYPHQYTVDPAAYYPQLPQFTSDQMQQYQMQLQQFAQHHQQHLPHQQDHAQQPQQPQQPQQSQPQPPYQQPQDQHAENEVKNKD